MSSKPAELKHYSSLKSKKGRENTHGLTEGELQYLDEVGVVDSHWYECYVQTEDFHRYEYKYGTVNRRASKKEWACEYTWNDSISFCFQAPCWFRANLHRAKLKKSMRQADDQPFVEVLERVKRGHVSDPKTQLFLNEMLRPLSQNGDSREKPLKLYTRKFGVQEENKREYDRLSGKEYTYHAIDKGFYTKWSKEEKGGVGGSTSNSSMYTVTLSYYPIIT